MGRGFLGIESALPKALERALGPSHWEVLGFGVRATTPSKRPSGTGARCARSSRDRRAGLLPERRDDRERPVNRYATPEEQRAKDAQDALIEKLAPVRQETVEELSRAEEERSTLRLLARVRTVMRVRSYEHAPAYTDEYLVMYSQKDRALRVTAALSELASDIRADGATPHLVISPMLRSWEGYHWKAIHELVASAARTSGWVVHESVECVRSESSRA